MPYAKALYNETLAEVVARVAPLVPVANVKADSKNSGLLKFRSEYMLKEGDQVWIPEEMIEPEWFSVTVGQKLALTITPPVRPFKLVLRYPDRSPIKGQAFKLVIDGKVFEGTTSGDGVLELEVPANATKGVVSVKGYQQTLEIGALEPVQTAKGIQARLRNLGYGVGPVDGKMGPQTAAAIRAFQRQNGLEVTGKVGPATRKKLEQEHGC